MAANSVNEAWKVLKNADIDAYWYLRTGRRLYIYPWNTAEDIRTAIESDYEESGGLEKPDAGFPIVPVEQHDLETLLAIILWGRE